MEKYIAIGERLHLIVSDDIYLDKVGDNFEPEMVELFREIIRSTDVVADIGANIGLTSILFSEIAQQVYSFEPSPTTFGLLSRNLDTADVQNAKTFNLGLGSSPGQSTITFSHNNRSGGFVSEKIRPSGGHVTEVIAIQTMDSFFSERSIRADVLKIDVEGFEKSVIEGGIATINRDKPIVIAEMNFFCLDVLQRITIPDFIDFMKSVFPRLYAVDNSNSSFEDLHDPERAYFVMHQHVVKHRFPNLVGGFDDRVGEALQRLVTRRGVREAQVAQDRFFATPKLTAFEGSIRVLDTISSMRGNEVLDVAVRIVNGTESDWVGYGVNPVRLSYHWKNDNDKVSIFEGKRTQLSDRVILAGNEHEQMIRVTAPPAAGNYALTVTLVQEGVGWFEKRGFSPDNVAISITN